MAGDGTDHETEHLHDLIQRSEPADSVAVEPRNYTGWVFLWLLFGFLIFNGLRATFADKPDKEKKHTAQELMLRQAVYSKRLAELSPLKAGNLDSGFESVAKAVEEDGKSSPAAALLYAEAYQEMGKRPPLPYLSTLLRSDNAEYKALSQLYASEKLSDGAAQRLTKSIESDSFPFELAKVHAREKAGLTPSGRDAIAPLWKAIAVAGVLLALGLISLLGIAVWVTFVALRSSGHISPLGFPEGNITPAYADRLALRAAQIVAAFLLFEFVAAIVNRMGLNRMVAGLIAPIGVLVFVFVIQRVPVTGRLITLADMGIRGGRLGKDVVWGVCAFAAEIPLMALLGLVGRKIFSFLPDPEHPASTLLQNRPDIGIVISVLVFGALIAPFWEEIAFRGLMFPAISKVTWGPVAGALISSLIFAAIHPQGPTTWLALGSIAAVSCALAYHTKSLVPSIVMHALHNFALLLGTLILF
ncbi:MAG: lysostaphin resistance A-like protein [Fimbriimonas sp.]